ncbi:MAG: rubrerythrin [Thermoguttaceae bacterium]
MSLHGTQTEKNLMKAFAGESQARNRYTYFASQAKKDGYEQVSAIFETTANQEKEHAKRFFKFLEGGNVEIVAAFPAGVIGTTAENLLAAANGEHEEWEILYPKFAAVAKEEGFADVARTFTSISVAEKRHELQYRRLHDAILNGTVWNRAGASWTCRNCGFTLTAASAPESCPACLHPKAYFELTAENF